MHQLATLPTVLIDSFGRLHTDLRISVTDRCNIRCFYCMPAEHVTFLPRAEILTFEEIERVVRILAGRGIRTLRLTGGEPLVRQNLDRLVRSLVEIPGIEDVALTTNGLLLADQTEALRAAGLHRLNISLDTLDPARFRLISRRDGFERVLEGIFAAQQAGFQKIKINTVAIRGITEPDIVPLGHFARQHGFEVRFIEFMPLDADAAWQNDLVLSGKEILARLASSICPLEPMPVSDPSQPATDYRFVDGVGQIGFINPVTQPFCRNCDRLRLTADGKLRNCLFSTIEWDIRESMRSDAPDEEIVAQVLACVQAKKPGHTISSDDFVKPQRAMYQIGG